jgi:hypothetical protein
LASASHTRLLHDHVDEVVRAAWLASDRVAELAAAGVVAGARGRAHALVRADRVLGQRTAEEALVVAPLHPAEVHHAVHHRHLDVLACTRALRLDVRGEEPDGEVQARPRIADLRAGDVGRTVRDAGGAHRAAHRLRDVLVGLEVGVRTARAKALDRAHDELRVDLVDPLPREPQAVEHAGAEVLHHDVAARDEVGEQLPALRRLHVDRDRPLVAS